MQADWNIMQLMIRKYSSHPANCLMARIGKRVDQESIQQFDSLRFMNRFMY